MCSPRELASLPAAAGGIREIAREGVTYRDKSPHLYRNMLWLIYN